MSWRMARKVASSLLMMTTRAYKGALNESSESLTAGKR